MADFAQSEGWGLVHAQLAKLAGVCAATMQSPTVAFAFMIPVICLAIGFSAKAPGSKAKASRPLSFTSGVMIVGSGPDEWEAPQPIINACLYYAKCPQRAELEKAAKLMCDYANFRGTAGPTRSWFGRRFGWTDIPVIYSDTITMIEVADGLEAHAAVERIMIEDLPTTGLDGEQLPMWHINVIENKAPGQESIVLVRTHHCIGDGVSLISVIDHVMTTTDGKPLDVRGALMKMRGDAGANKKPALPSLLAKLVKALAKVAAVGVSPFDTPVALNGPKDAPLKYGPRCYVDFPDLPLEFVKAVKDKAAVTVNDVMLSLTTGALRRHLIARGTFPQNVPVQMRALLPIAMPRKNKHDERFEHGLENIWGFASADMCAGEADIVKRLNAVEKVTTQLKGSLVPLVQLALQNTLLPFVPAKVAKQLCKDVFSRHSIVFSNVPGPPMPVAFGGEKIVRMQMLFPNILLQVGILSYAGRIQMNCVADARSVSAPELRAAFVAEAEAMCAALGMASEAQPHIEHLRTQCANMDKGLPPTAST